MKNILLTLLLFPLSTYSQDIDILEYIENPNEDDFLCLSELAKAKEEVNNGKLVHTEPRGITNFDARYINELKELCNQYKVEFKYESTGCVRIKEQTEGCYAAFMDKALSEKFNTNFREKIRAEADSIFMNNVINGNQLVTTWNCDERPTICYGLNQSEEFSHILSLTTPNILSNKEKQPFLDFEFIIEKEGKIHDLKVIDEVLFYDWNEQYKEELKTIAFKHILENAPVWYPGKINGKPVRTLHNLRIRFHNTKTQSK